MIHQSTLPVLLVALLLPAAQGLNFFALETPVLDSIGQFICGSSESPLCNTLSLVPGVDFEEEEIDRDEESGTTLTQFLARVGCDVALLPTGMCTKIYAGDEQAMEEGAMMIAEIENGEGESKTIVDGFIMGALCGENGVVQEGVCNVLVGRNKDSGLYRTFCVSGVMLLPLFCRNVDDHQPPAVVPEEVAAIPEEVVGGGQRQLRAAF